MKTYFDKSNLRAAIFCCSLFIAGACSDNNKDSKDQAENMNEEKFNREGEKEADKLVEAYSGNLFEIKASENAIAKASTGEVKRLAETMVAAHTKMNGEVEKLAKEKNVTLPTDLSEEQRKKIEKLNEKTGLDYDKEYCDEMKNKHDDAVKMLEKISEKCDDAELKTWATQTLPEVKAHLGMVEATRDHMKAMKQDIRQDRRGDDENSHDGRN